MEEWNETGLAVQAQVARHLLSHHLNPPPRDRDVCRIGRQALSRKIELK
jgi:hypothetical protein